MKYMYYEFFVILKFWCCLSKCFYKQYCPNDCQFTHDVVRTCGPGYFHV